MPDTPSSTKQRRQRNRRRRLRQNKNRKVKKDVKKAVARYAQPRVIQPATRISECAKDYARAVTNPFGRFSNLPCIPDFTIVPSAKLQCKIRGTFSTGSAGVGYVALNPLTAIFNNESGLGGVIDQPVIYTTAAYSDAYFHYEISGGAITTAGVAAANSNSPYKNENQDWTWRVVGAGIQVRYMGSNFRNQGSVYLYQSPGNEDIPHTSSDVTNGVDFLKSNFTVMVPVSRKSEFVYYQPKRHNDTFYQSEAEALPTRTGDQNFILLIYVEGGDEDTPQSWSFEATVFYEIQGQGLPLTPSHSDPNGYAAVVSSLPNVNPETSPESLTQNVLSRAMNYLGNQISGAVSTAAPIVANRLMDRYLGGGISMPPLPTITEL